MNETKGRRSILAGDCFYIKISKSVEIKLPGKIATTRTMQANVSFIRITSELDYIYQNALKV